MDRHITAPINKETARSLHAGDYVYITGTMYTARDAAHKRMYEILQKGGELPVDWKDQVIYYITFFFLCKVKMDVNTKICDFGTFCCLFLKIN